MTITHHTGEAAMRMILNKTRFGILTPENQIVAVAKRPVKKPVTAATQQSLPKILLSMSMFKNKPRPRALFEISPDKRNHSRFHAACGVLLQIIGFCRLIYGFVDTWDDRHGLFGLTRGHKFLDLF